MIARRRTCVSPMKPDTPVANRLALDVSTLFDEPLKDLGDEDPAFAGILSPASADRSAARGVTDQFLANAADYHRRYENVEHFRVLIDDALAALDPAPKPKVILDVGSGAGIEHVLSETQHDGRLEDELAASSRRECMLVVVKRLPGPRRQIGTCLRYEIEVKTRLHGERRHVVVNRVDAAVRPAAAIRDRFEVGAIEKPLVVELEK